jgi:3-deoxy-manno-octulosonate cytidylyltransferase (CMP-KDO synthetase)
MTNLDARIVGVIPSRWGSTRFPGKSLAPIRGKPLVLWVVEAAHRAERLDEVLVATDDRRIADVVEEAGARAVMTARDHPSGTDRVAEAVRGIEAEVVVNIQGDEPLVDPALVDRLAATLLGDPRWDMATAASPIERREDLENPSIVKAVWAEDGTALYFSRSPIPYVRDEPFDAAATLHWGHAGLYAYRRAFLERLVATPPCPLEKAEKLEQLRALHIGGRIAVLKAGRKAIGVDTPEDLAYVEKLLQAGEAPRRDA